VITTKVKQLTAMNIKALRAIDANVDIVFGKTYVIFDATPLAALKAVESAMVIVSQTEGINSTYNSLRAVQRKLASAAPYRIEEFAGKSGVTQLTNYVQIAR
jgi:hypothetical protein